MKLKKRIQKGILIISMSIVSFTMLFPFIWMISTSLKEKKDALEVPIRLIPSPFNFEAYKEVWEIIPLLNSAWNTMKIIIPVLTFGIFFSALAAFAFAKMYIPGKNIIFIALLSTMMIPPIVNLIPQYVFWGSFGLSDSLIPLIAPGIFGGVGIMFFLRQYISGLPKEYIEAARIDGAGWFQIFLQIFVPLMKPALATQVIINFMGCWNDFMGPLIYLDSEKNYTVQLAIRLLDTTGRQTMEYPLVMAGSTLACLPLLLIYIFFQKYFVNSMVASGVKG